MSEAFAGIQAACETNIFELHSLEINAQEEKVAELVAQWKRAENLYDAAGKALATFSNVLRVIAGQLVDYSSKQKWKKSKGKTP